MGAEAVFTYSLATCPDLNILRRIGGSQRYRSAEPLSSADRGDFINYAVSPKLKETANLLTRVWM
jgi:hypothetical protein